MTMQQRDCEFRIRERCSLTGRGCFCEPTLYLVCTRREFALDYERRHTSAPGGLPLPSKIKLVCSEDSPLPGL
jgi:hypothetical protein